MIEVDEDKDHVPGNARIQQIAGKSKIDDFQEKTEHRHQPEPEHTGEIIRNGKYQIGKMPGHIIPVEIGIQGIRHGVQPPLCAITLIGNQVWWF
jgi:hypothetical protein